jgi:hypothetical protein
MLALFGLLSSLDLFCVLLNVLHTCMSVWKFECPVLLLLPSVARHFFLCTYLNEVSIFSVIYKLFIESFESSGVS